MINLLDLIVFITIVAIGLALGVSAPHRGLHATVTFSVLFYLQLTIRRTENRFRLRSSLPEIFLFTALCIVVGAILTAVTSGLVAAFADTISDSVWASNALAASLRGAYIGCVVTTLWLLPIAGLMHVLGLVFMPAVNGGHHDAA